MPDHEQDRSARNRALIAGMATPPTKAQILAELDFEIDEALKLVTAADLPTLVRVLRSAKLEVSRLRQRAEYKD
jgi:hypothetical protein